MPNPLHSSKALTPTDHRLVMRLVNTAWDVAMLGKFACWSARADHLDSWLGTYGLGRN